MISIIVTAYNVASTIVNTIQSILNQTYKNFELIIVEDCSTDNTLDLIKSFKDKRIKLIQQPENCGAGLSRRVGVLNSSGEYTIFVDGDDTIEKDCLEIMYKSAKETNSDITSCGVRVFDDRKELIYKGECGIYKDLDKFTHTEYFFSLYLNNKLIKRHLWEKVTYSSLRFIEDTPTAFRLFYYANQISYIDYIGYNYFQNSNSLCHTATNTKYCIYLILSQIENAEFFKDKDIKYRFLGNKEKIVSSIGLFNLNNLTFKDISPYIKEYNKIIEYVNNINI